MSNIIILNENDVLMGRGGRNFKHGGNEQLRRLAHSRVKDYQKATKKQKAGISREILDQIHNMEPKGRFVLKNYSTYEWEEVSPSVAREKVCQALRDAVATEKVKLGVEPPLPNVLDVLSSEILAAQRSNATKKDANRQSIKSRPIVTPVKNEEYNRSGLSDDFDLFDGELLLGATEDEVLKDI